ncbi:heavy metal translocating P-type ATPase [Ramlibacter solisilvae]|uniref:ATPase P n=1 Tax=Ramlibacter tataouinensis TaxID=94132 RepID=A0A127JXV2_9BURK|nr:heavy metal translocating P-type ATPase [Ramlibacter tataouinensis]AMO24754.1 ATPase P [Ramlibacter tataouinensis]
MQLATAALDAPARRAHDPWLALDEPAQWQEFSRELAAPAGTWESHIAIEGMHCPACSLTVEDALAGCAGVREVQVNGATATARLVWSPGTGKPSDWWHALRRSGYGAAPAGDLLTAAPRRRAQRMMLWRWLVAGFCMMQVMMYAVPAYVAEPGEITPDIQALLRWASWLMTLPVMLFSCGPFFQSAWHDLRRLRVGMDVPVALGLAIAFAASTAATFDGSSVFAAEVWFDSITMFVFFLLSGRLLEQRLRDRTAGSLEALARRLPESVERQDAQGGFERVSVRKLAPGDCIRVLPGEAFPADGVVLAGDSRVDEALLTGESRALARRQGDKVVAGSHNLTSPLLVQVTRCGADTRFAEIVSLMERASMEKPASAQLADRIATPFLLAVLAAAAAAATWWWSAGPAHALGVAIAVLIVTCPCALSLATPAATLAAAGALARRGILPRSLQAMETCAAVDTVVFDKTGTLTEPRLALVAVRTRPGLDAGEALALAAALASHSLHPVSRAVLGAAGETPWQAGSVVEVAGRGVEGEVLAEANGPARRMRLGSASFCQAAEPEGEGGRAHLADAQGWLATFEFDEALRSDAPLAVGALQRLQLQVQLLSGDRTASVVRLASRTGIATSRAEQTPEDKLAHVCSLQGSGHVVAMVGDGMNDAPVLARANVSIAMGQGVPLAQARSDFVVSGAQLSAIPMLLAQARRTRRIVRENLAWAAAYNLASVPMAVAGWMPPWLAGLGMAASSLLVVLNSARLARLPHLPEAS